MRKGLGTVCLQCSRRVCVRTTYDMMRIFRECMCVYRKKYIHMCVHVCSACNTCVYMCTLYTTCVPCLQHESKCVQYSQHESACVQCLWYPQYSLAIHRYGVPTIITLLTIIGLFPRIPSRCRALLQKKPMISRSLLIVATPYMCTSKKRICVYRKKVHVCTCVQCL